MEEDNLYAQFRLNEPWDSPHNLELLERMPQIYRMPGLDEQPGMTHYRVFVGKCAAFEMPEAGAVATGRRQTDFRGGTDKPIFVAEAADPVPWTKPDELEYAPDRPLPRSKLSLRRLPGRNAQCLRSFDRRQYSRGRVASDDRPRKR